MITENQLEDAVERADSLFRAIINDLREPKWRNRVAELLDEMLRNPHYPYRSTKQLAKVFGDTTPDQLPTRAILGRIPGVRHSVGDRDSWINEDNWVFDADGRIRRTAEGHGILRPQFEPGNE